MDQLQQGRKEEPSWNRGKLCLLPAALANQLAPGDGHRRSAIGNVSIASGGVHAGQPWPISFVLGHYAQILVNFVILPGIPLGGPPQDGVRNGSSGVFEEAPEGWGT